MQKTVFYIIIILTFFNNCMVQTKTNQIKEIWVYEYFNPKGYTTAGVAQEFQFLEFNNINKIKLERKFVDFLNNQLYFANTRKVFQEKTGQNLIFAEIITHNNETKRIIINSNGLIDYFYEKKAYFFKNEKEKIWSEKIYKTILQKIESDKFS